MLIFLLLPVVVIARKISKLSIPGFADGSTGRCVQSLAVVRQRRYSAKRESKNRRLQDPDPELSRNSTAKQVRGKEGGGIGGCDTEYLESTNKDLRSAKITSHTLAINRSKQMFFFFLERSLAWGNGEGKDRKPMVKTLFLFLSLSLSVRVLQEEISSACGKNDWVFF